MVTLVRQIVGSPRKRAIFANWEAQAAARKTWRRNAAFFYAEDQAYLEAPSSKRPTHSGSGLWSGRHFGQPLAIIWLGIDFSPKMIELAREAHPDLEFVNGDIECPDTLNGLTGPFDIILIVDTLGALDDCQGTLERLNRSVHA